MLPWKHAYVSSFCKKVLFYIFKQLYLKIEKRFFNSVLIFFISVSKALEKSKWMASVTFLPTIVFIKEYLKIRWRFMIIQSKQLTPPFLLLFYDLDYFFLLSVFFTFFVLYHSVTYCLIIFLYKHINFKMLNTAYMV